MRERTKSSIQEIVDVLKKRPEQRSQNEIKTLITSTETIPFFEKYIQQGKENVIQKCCRHMKYESFNKSEKVFEIDSVGTKFYLIISGKVGVYIKDPNYQDMQQSSQIIIKEQDKIQEISKQKRNAILESQITPSKRPMKYSIRASIFSSLDLNERQQENNDNKRKSKQNDNIIKQQQSQIQQLQQQQLQSQKLNLTKEKQNETTQEEIKMQLRQRFKKLNSIYDRGIKSPQAQSEAQDKWDSFSPKQAKNMICVKVIEVGNAFGELALLNNKPRLATIICLEDCQFGILEKDDFTKILKQIEENLLEDEISLLADLHIFQSWNKNLLKQLYLNTQKLNFNRDQIIFAEGDPSDNVYIVSQGEFINIDLIYFFCTKGFKMYEFYKDKEQQTENDLVSEQNLDSIKKLLNGQKQTELIQIQMSLLTPFEMFGEEDLLEKQNRTYSVKCSSLTGQLIVIKNRNFNLRILQDDYSRKYLYDRLEKKKQIFQERAEKSIQSLMKYKKYLFSQTDKAFDVCIDAIKKQSEQQTIYYKQREKQIQQKDQKQNDKSPEKNTSKDENQQNKSIERDNQNKYNGDQLQMLQKVYNYDLKYNYEKLQKGMKDLKLKQKIIRKNEANISQEMLLYSQKFNQYQPDKFINMNNLEEQCNQQQFNTSPQRNSSLHERNSQTNEGHIQSVQRNIQSPQRNIQSPQANNHTPLQNIQSPSKNIKSNEKSPQNNMMGDQLLPKNCNSALEQKNYSKELLLNHYKEYIFQQSTIHFKIKCHQAGKPKSDRSQIDYLQILRQRRDTDQIQKVQLQRQRIMSANNQVYQGKANIQNQSSDRLQQNFISNNQINKHIKTEVTPEKNINNSFSQKAKRSSILKIIALKLPLNKEAKDQIQNTKSQLQESKDTKDQQSQEDEVNIQSKHQLQQMNKMIEQISQQDIKDKNKKQNIKFFPYQQQQQQLQQKFLNLKQQQYEANQFIQKIDDKSMDKSLMIKSTSFMQQSQKYKNQSSQQIDENSQFESPTINKSFGHQKKRSISSQILKRINKTHVRILDQSNISQTECQQNINKSQINTQEPLNNSKFFGQVNIKELAENKIDYQSHVIKPKWKFEKYDILGNQKTLQKVIELQKH